LSRQFSADCTSDKVSRRVRIKDHWAEQRIFTVRGVVAASIAAVLLFAVAGRLFFLQVLRHDYYAELSQGNRVRIDPIPPSRGLILDRHGVVLAENQPAFQLELIRDLVGKDADVDVALARLVNIGLLDADAVTTARRAIKSRHSYESVPIKLQLNDEQMGRFAVHRHEFTGIDIRTRLTRHYPFGPIAVHALGYVAAISESDLDRIDTANYAGTTLIGKLGVEGAYEKDLHGRAGYREVLVNAAGRPVEKQGAFTPLLHVKQPIAGRDLILGLDMRAQRAAEEALEGKRGAVIAIDPHNGDIVTFASTPGFDPNSFARGLTNAEYNALQSSPDKPLLNRGLRGAYPPGSTVKPLYALAALKYGLMPALETRYCRGFYQLAGSSHRYRDWKPKGHGVVDMRRAISQSCDVYFYQIAEKLGIERMHEFMTAFGFGAATGVDISGEKTGLMPSASWKKRAYKQIWYPGETLIVGIGQGYMLATPMQLAHAVQIMSARGENYRPRLVIGEREPGTAVATKIASQPLPSISLATPEQWSVIVDGMVAVTSPGGTAVRSAAGAPYRIAGKTGTAQVFSIGQNEKYNEKDVDERLRDHALFISFAPAEDPKLAVAVLVENGRSGSGTAAPIARKIFDAYLLPSMPP
jgi:penicillin-binding protein 2